MSEESKAIVVKNFNIDKIYLNIISGIEKGKIEEGAQRLYLGIQNSTSNNEDIFLDFYKICERIALSSPDTLYSLLSSRNIVKETYDSIKKNVAVQIEGTRIDDSNGAYYELLSSTIPNLIGQGKLDISVQEEFIASGRVIPILLRIVYKNHLASLETLRSSFSLSEDCETEQNEILRKAVENFQNSMLKIKTGLLRNESAALLESFSNIIRTSGDNNFEKMFNKTVEMHKELLTYFSSQDTSSIIDVKSDDDLVVEVEESSLVDDNLAIVITEKLQLLIRENDKVSMTHIKHIIDKLDLIVNKNSSSEALEDDVENEKLLNIGRQIESISEVVNSIQVKISNEENLDTQEESKDSLLLRKILIEIQSLSNEEGASSSNAEGVGLNELNDKLSQIAREISDIGEQSPSDSSSGNTMESVKVLSERVNGIKSDLMIAHDEILAMKEENKNISSNVLEIKDLVIGLLGDIKEEITIAKKYREDFEDETK